MVMYASRSVRPTEVSAGRELMCIREHGGVAEHFGYVRSDERVGRRDCYPHAIATDSVRAIKSVSVTD